MAATQVLTTAGKTFTANKMADSTNVYPVPKWIGIGTGVHTAAVGDTALTTEVESRGAGGTASASTNIFTLIQTTTATAIRAITEAGLFTATTAGTMVVSATFDVVTLQSGDSIQITANIQYT